MTQDWKENLDKNLYEIDDWGKRYYPLEKIESLIESLLSEARQSFIKYLQSDIERWTKVFDYHNDMSNERHSTMRNVARTEIENLKAQIKELEV